MVRGRLSRDPGNQQTSDLEVGSEARIEADTVTLLRARDGEIVGSGRVGVDGRFAFESPAGRGPFLLRAESGSEVRGQALLVVPLRAGETVVAMPISPETTAEAETYLELRAQGHVDSEIDVVGLMTTIDAQLAAADSTSADLAEVVWATQSAFLETASRIRGEAVTAEQLARAELSAHEQLAYELDAAADAKAKRDAWQMFFTRVSADVEAELGLSASAQATAWAAASAVLSASTDASVVAEWLIAASARPAHQAAAGARFEGEIRAAYDAYFDALASAMTAEAAARAKAELAADLEAVMEAVIESEGGTREDAEAIRSALAPLVSRLEEELQAALEQTTDVPRAVSAAYAKFHADAQAEAEAREGGLSESAIALVVQMETTVAAGLDVVAGLGGVTIVGSISTGLGLQAGADGIVDGLFGIDLSRAASARLVSRTTGDVLAEGTVANDTYEIPNAERTDDVVVQILDGSGEPIGAVELTGAPNSTPISTESTVEALVRMSTEADAVMTLLLVDRAVAASAMAEGRVALVAKGVVAAQLALGEALGMTQAELAAAGDAAVADLQASLRDAPEQAAAAHAAFEAQYGAALGASAGARAKAWARAGAAFRAVVGAAGDARLSATADARGLMASASGESEALHAQLEALSLDATLGAGIDAALDDLVSAVASARSGTDVDAAGRRFETAILGDGSFATGVGGLLESLVEARFGADAALRSAIEASVSSCGTLATSAATEVKTAANGASSTDAFVASLGTIFGSLEAELSGAADVSAATTDSAGAGAVSKMMLLAYVGLYGEL